MTAVTLDSERTLPATGARLLPFAAVFMRFPLIMLGNMLWWIGLRAAGHPSPWEHALLWGNIHVVIIADALTVAFLLWAVRREGLALRTLLGWERTRPLRDAAIGVGVGLVLLIVLNVGGVIGALLVFGPEVLQPQQMPVMTRADLPPLWYFIWGLLVLPISVSITEELLYRGYAQPRLEAALGSRWLALLVMALGFGVQHMAFAAVDVPSMLARFIGTFVAGLALGWFYLKLRRLLPLMVAHWLVNFIGLGLFPLLWYLSLS